MTSEGDLVDRVGVRLDPEFPATTTLPQSSGIVRNGQPIVSALMLAADVASGIPLHAPGVAAVLTTAFSLRRTTIAPHGVITTSSTRLFRQGNRVVDTVAYRDDQGHAIAHGRISFVVRAHPIGERIDHVDVRPRFVTPRTRPVEEPLSRAAGIRTGDPAVGEVVLEPTERVRRKGGIVQGAFVTLMGETSALHLAEHATSTPTCVSAIDADYLARVDAPRIVATSRWLGETHEGAIESILRDADTGDVLAAFLIGTRPLSDPRSTENTE